MSDLPEKPITRKEMYLSAIAGEDTAIPDPAITREEMYLKYIAEHGGGSGTVDAYTKTESDVRYLQKSGGALTGDVTTSVTEFTNASLVTKQFVMQAIANITDFKTEVFPNG